MDKIEKSTDYKIIKLDNGETLIAEVDHKGWADNGYITVSYAMEIINFNQTPTDGTSLSTSTIFLSRWNPYTDDESIIIPLNKITAITNASVAVVAFYINTLEGFNKELKAEDSFEDLMDEEASADPLESLAEIFNEMVKKTKRTLH